MNKLFTILCTLVLITACGGPSWDGQWSGVESQVDNNIMEISDGSVNLMENGKVVDTCTFDASGSTSAMDCGKEDGINAALDGDIITLTMDGNDRVFTFKRD
jgi:hypothetical protein